MYPARSLIAFSTLSGLGFGLLVWLGIDPAPPTGWVALVFFALAHGLCLAGLAASALLLRRRDRALKAFSQWRSSWLSREAWAAVAALLAGGGHGLALMLDQPLLPLGWLSAALALAAVTCTAMIYAQLKAVPRWHHWSTPALFLLTALAGGALLSGHVTAALILLPALGALQIWTWYDGDTRFARSGSTPATATGLAGRGSVRPLFPAQTGSTYVLDEMVFVVARRHLKKLRVLGLAFMVVLPVPLLLLPMPHLFGAVALVSHVAGVVLSRWVFFAEAEHVVGLYHGRG